MTRCIVIRNPVSRRSLSEERLQAALDHARAAGWHIEGVATAYEGHGTEIARYAAAAGAGVIIVNGGDGTINEVVNGIAHSDVALAVIPGGTNVWAGVGCTTSVAGGAGHRERRGGRPGRAGGRSSCPWPASARRRDRAARRRRWKRWFGRLAYLAAGS
jgi:hypothetical protein